MKNNKCYDVCEVCLKEMFGRVGMEYPNKEFTKQEDWFQKKTWTKDQENDFRKWMSEYLKKKLKWNKKQIEKEIGMFLLMWGWKVKDS